MGAVTEEVGLRGYMLTRLFAARVPQPLFVSGVIWSLWHFPLILSGVYAAGPLTATRRVFGVVWPRAVDPCRR